MPARWILFALVAVTAGLASGCILDSHKSVRDKFYWDDKNKRRLPADYAIPEAPESETPSGNQPLYRPVPSPEEQLRDAPAKVHPKR